MAETSRRSGLEYFSVGRRRRKGARRQVLGFEALEGRQLLSGTIQVVDDGDAGFSTTGAWTAPSPDGYQGSHHWASPGAAGRTASWSVPVTPGATYRVATTWNAYDNHSTAAPYTVLDGARAIGSARLDQRPTPGSFTDAGTAWADLGTFTVSGGTLTVRVADQADGYVVADAIRVEQVASPGSQAPPILQAPAAVQVVDDGDAGFSTTGAWTAPSPDGYQGSHHWASPGAAGRTASWSVPVTPGATYRVATTWNAYDNHSTAAPYTVLDGARAIGSARLDQRPTPGSFTDAGTAWADLGTFTVSGGTLTVRVADQADGYVVADAIRVEQVASPGSPAGLQVSAGPPLSADEGQSVAFAGSVTGGTSPLSYAWDFGDGTTATGLNSSHAYAQDGTYSATLTASDGAGITGLARTTVTVKDVPPSVSLGGPDVGIVGLVLALTATVTDPSPADMAAGYRFFWNYGDGTTGTDAAPQHAYAQPGTYVVTLAVTDGGGTTGTATKTVTVAAPAPAGQSLAMVGLTPGWATFGQALPSGAARGSLQVGNLATQTDVKTTWPDGSIRFAVVTVNVPVAGNYPLTAAPAPSGSFRPTGPDASVRLKFGSTWQPLGSFDVKSGKLGVILGDATTGDIVADAIRIDDGRDDDPNARIIDDGDPGFAAIGAWTRQLGQGNGGDNLWLTAGGKGANGASWTFTGLPAGRYRVSASWTAWPAHAATAPYSLTDGNTALATVRVDQRPAPAGIEVGSVYTASPSNAASTDVWLDGPLVKEWRQVVAPIGANGQPHPFLRVVFDTRAYADGRDRLDVTVENVLDLAGATAATYSVDVTAGGAPIWHHDPVSQGYLTRWRKVFDLGGLVESAVTPDFGPAIQAKAIPQYLELNSKAISTPTGPAFDILGNGGLSPDMTLVGGRPEIAPVMPDWAAQYVLYKDPAQLRYVLANGDLSGSWPIHILNADRSTVTIDRRPDFWLDGRGDDKPAGDMGSTGPLKPDLAHVPSIAFLPYLITGDRYYADELKAWGNYALLGNWPGFGQNIRHGSTGLLGEVLRGGTPDFAAGVYTGQQVRGLAWGLRLMAQAAGYLPDADPDRAYLAQKLANNLAWLDRYADAHRSPLGTYFETANPYNSLVNSSIWQNDYVAFAIGYANDQGIAGGLKMRDKLARFVLNVFTSPDVPESYRPTDYWRVGTFNPDGTIAYFPDWKSAVAASPQPTYGLAGYYGVDIRLSLMVAVQAGYPGAKEALAYVTKKIAVENPDLQLRTGWAIAGPTGPKWTLQ